MAEDAAQAVAADLLAEDAEATDATETVEQTAPEVELPSWEADTSGIEDILDAPEDEYQLEDDDDPEPVLAQTNEYTDPEVAKLRAQLAKAEKQIRYQTDLRAKDNLKGWRAEAARRFPLADVDEIDATSRRAVLKKAQEQHTRYARKVEPILKTLDDLKAATVQSAKEEVREEAQQAWGKPQSGPQVAQVTTAEDNARFARTNFRTLHERTLALIRAGKLEI